MDDGRLGFLFEHRVEGWVAVNHIFIDMDGVVADFVSAAMAVHGHTYVPEDWPAGFWNLEEVMKMTTEKFWKRIDEQFEHFWRLLAPYPWAENLIQEVAHSGVPWSFLSSPSSAAASSAGKVQWLQNWRGRHFRDYILTPASNKRLLAGPGRVLIDDSDRNCDQWASAGGSAILIPQPWNSLHGKSAGCDRVAYVAERLCELMEVTAA